MPGALTEVTELSTALGMLVEDLARGVSQRPSRLQHVSAGHVEVRWSHGRFNGSPEAKVYLDTPLSGTPGYFPLE